MKRGTQRIFKLICVSLTIFFLYFLSTLIDVTPNKIKKQGDHFKDVHKDLPMKSNEGITDRKPLILAYTTVFHEVPKFLNDCPIRDECLFSINRSDINLADAVVFHGGDFTSGDIPVKRGKALQKWVFYSMETHLSEQKGWDDLKPDWIMDYMALSDIPARYGGMFVNPKDTKARNFKVIANFTIEEVLKDKQFKGAVGFISNCKSKERLQVVKALSKHIRVDVGGKCALDKTKTNLCPIGTDCTPIINWYYFYLALENQNCVDYVTEKFTNYLHLPVVLVVLKRKVYENLFPPEAFIAVDDFNSPEEMALHLKHLMRHPREYYKLFKWRSKWGRAQWNSKDYEMGFCGLCAKLKKFGNKKTEPIQNLRSWLQEKSACSTMALSEKWLV